MLRHPHDTAHDHDGLRARSRRRYPPKTERVDVRARISTAIAKRSNWRWEPASRSG